MSFSKCPISTQQSRKNYWMRSMLMLFFLRVSGARCRARSKPVSHARLTLASPYVARKMQNKNNDAFSAG